MEMKMSGRLYCSTAQVLLMLLLASLVACATKGAMDVRLHKKQDGTELLLPSAIDLVGINGIPLDVLMFAQKQKSMLVDSGEVTLQLRYLDYHINMDNDEEKISSDVILFKSELPANSRIAVEIPPIKDISAARAYVQQPLLQIRRLDTGELLPNLY